MSSLLNEVEINRHVNKLEVKGQSHVKKRNAEDGDENVTLTVFN